MTPQIEEAEPYDVSFQTCLALRAVEQCVCSLWVDDQSQLGALVTCLA